MGDDNKITRDSLRTPRAAAIAGILFAVLLGAALVLIRIAVPADPGDAPSGSTTRGARPRWCSR